MRARLLTRPQLACALLLVQGIMLLPGCAAPRPSMISTQPEAMVVVQSTLLPDSTPFYAHFAHHSWIDLKPQGWDRWIRLEVDRYTGVEVETIPSKKFYTDVRFGGKTSVLAIYRSDTAEVLISQILAETHRQSIFENQLVFDPKDLQGFLDGYDRGFFSYQPWTREYDTIPGPNSNTFIASLIDEISGLEVELHHNAVGKDYPDRFRIGTTSAGLGFEVDSPYLGCGIGLKQGIELHLIGLTAGLSIWPPAIKIPILPRIGFQPGWLFWGALSPDSTANDPSER